jgi:hypothetical protein
MNKTKWTVVVVTALVCLGAAEAARIPTTHSPKGFPMIQFATQPEAAAFDFGLETAVKGILARCLNKGYFGNGEFWFDCKRRHLKKT